MKSRVCHLVGTLVLAGVFLLPLFPAGMGRAGEYPSRPIQVVVGWTPGASEDLRVRALIPKMTEVLGQPLVVINKPGAASGLGLNAVAKSKPDGYTIGNSSTSGLLFAPHMQKTEYATLTDFTYLAGTYIQPYAVVVRSEAPWKTFEEFIAYVKENPGKIKYGTAGMGGLVHVYMEMLAKDWGLKWVHVPFSGDAPNITALLGGHVPISAISSAFVPQAKAGKLRPLALITARRMTTFPDVPTLKDLGFKRDLRANEAGGICGPKGLPVEVIGKLENAIKQAVHSDDYQRVMKEFDNEARFRDSKTSREFFQEMYPRIGQMIQEAGLDKQ